MIRMFPGREVAPALIAEQRRHQVDPAVPVRHLPARSVGRDDVGIVGIGVFAIEAVAVRQIAPVRVGVVAEPEPPLPQARSAHRGLGAFTRRPPVQAA